MNTNALVVPVTQSLNNNLFCIYRHFSSSQGLNVKGLRGERGGAICYSFIQLLINAHTHTHTHRHCTRWHGLIKHGRFGKRTQKEAQ